MESVAVIRSNSESRFRISTFKGMNECPEGSAELSVGEGAKCVNFRVTEAGGLEVRPGWKSRWKLPGAVEGLWEGEIGGAEARLAAAGGKLWRLGASGEAESLGNIGEGRCRFFRFGGKLYLLTGKRYLMWPGHGQVTDVAGYRPVVVVSATAAGGGTVLEEVNRLNGLRRGFYSPDGSGKVFQLPETEISSVDYVLERGTGEPLEYSCDKEKGTVTLKKAPEKGVNTLEIGWTKGMGSRGDILACKGWEIYSGQSDKRVFLYGGADNRAFYSGMDYDGQETAEYFPAGNVLTAGSEESPITGMVRHYAKLLVFKKHEAYSVETATATLEDGRSIATFFLRPIHRDLGNEAAGTVTLVNNEPRTVSLGGIYQWKASYGSYATLDERVAKRISQKAEETLKALAGEDSECFDDGAGEWYLVRGGKALVHNYRRDAWYVYENFPARCFARMEGELHFGTEDGRVCRVSREYRNDDGAAIQALWRSGDMDFDCGYRRKWGKLLWLKMKPESGGRVLVRTRSDLGQSEGVEVRSTRMNYLHLNYGHFSYDTDHFSHIKRVEPWAGSWGYGQIQLESDSASETATILGLEGTVRKGRFQR